MYMAIVPSLEVRDMTTETVYAIKCDWCKETIAHTTSLRESFAGGMCGVCKRAEKRQIKTRTHGAVTHVYRDGVLLGGAERSGRSYITFDADGSPLGVSGKKADALAFVVYNADNPVA